MKDKREDCFAELAKLNEHVETMPVAPSDRLYPEAELSKVGKEKKRKQRAKTKRSAFGGTRSSGGIVADVISLTMLRACFSKVVTFIASFHS